MRGYAGFADAAFAGEDLLWGKAVRGGGGDGRVRERRAYEEDFFGVLEGHFFVGEMLRNGIGFHLDLACRCYSIVAKRLWILCDEVLDCVIGLALSS